jgi:hypothetical protein
MHQILLITALTATSGLFGGGRHYGRGHCGYPTVGCYAPVYSHAPAYAPSCAPCGGSAAPAFSYAAPAQSYAAPTPQAAPAAQAPAAPAKQAPSAPPAPQASAPAAPPIQAAYYPSFYYPAAPGCANGNCARR